MAIYDLFFITQDLFTHPMIVEVHCQHSWTKWPCRIHSTTCEADLQIKIHRTTMGSISLPIYFGANKQFICFSEKIQMK